MDIHLLKQAIRDVLPILDANLGAAYTEYMNADIPAGAFGYVRSRHETALAVLDRDDLDPKSAFLACAMLAIDLQSGLKDVEKKVEAQEKVDNWWKCYKDAGFTDINSFYNFPTLPGLSM